MVSAPNALAAHLGLDPTKDVKQCMDALAMLRARACLNSLVAHGVAPKQLYATALGQGGKIEVNFNIEGEIDGELRYAHVPIRFIPASGLELKGWRTLHLALNCHFDPLPDERCSHQQPCGHRSKAKCDHPTKTSVRSWEGKRADFELSAPVPSAADRARAARRHKIDGSRGDLQSGNGMSGMDIAAAMGLVGGPRCAYAEGTRSAFYSATRTPNPHVGGDGQMGPLAWKTSLVWVSAAALHMPPPSGLYPLSFTSPPPPYFSFLPSPAFLLLYTSGCPFTSLLLRTSRRPSGGGMQVPRRRRRDRSPAVGARLLPRPGCLLRGPCGCGRVRRVGASGAGGV